MNPLLAKLALEAFAWHNLQYAEIEKRALDPIKWAVAPRGGEAGNETGVETKTTGDTSALELMTNEYFVAFFNDTIEKPMFFNTDESINGMKDSVNQLLGGKKIFNSRVISLKDNENVAVFYDHLSIEFRENIVARLFTIENWQLIDEKWFLVVKSRNASFNII